MRTALIHRYGGTEVLQVEDIPEPQPGTGEAIVAVIASTINPVDVKTRTPGTVQQVPGFPAVLGWDIAGIVLHAPAESPWQPGDHVIAMNPPLAGSGSWSENISIPATLLVAAPRTVDLATAATLPLAGLTAQQALRRLEVQPRERVLVTGAAGAVGGFAVQLLAANGHDVAGLVSRPEHIETARALGAAHAAAEQVTFGQFDAIFDTAGVYHPGLLAAGGRFVTISDDEIPEAITAKASNASHNYVRHDPDGLRVLVTSVDSGQLKLRVAERYPLARIRDAHNRFEAGSIDGKIVITT